MVQVKWNTNIVSSHINYKYDAIYKQEKKKKNRISIDTYHLLVYWLVLLKEQLHCTCNIVYSKYL